MAKKRVKLFLAGQTIHYAVLREDPCDLRCWICGGAGEVRVLLGFCHSMEIDVDCPACKNDDGISTGNIRDHQHALPDTVEVKLHSVDLSVDKDGNPKPIYMDANGNDLDPDCIFDSKEMASHYARSVLHANYNKSAAAKRSKQFRKNLTSIVNVAWSKSEKKP